MKTWTTKTVNSICMNAVYVLLYDYLYVMFYLWCIVINMEAFWRLARGLPMQTSLLALMGYICFWSFIVPLGQMDINVNLNDITSHSYQHFALSDSVPFTRYSKTWHDEISLQLAWWLSLSPSPTSVSAGHRQVLFMYAFLSDTTW